LIRFRDKSSQTRRRHRVRLRECSDHAAPRAARRAHGRVERGRQRDVAGDFVDVDASAISGSWPSANDRQIVSWKPPPPPATEPRYAVMAARRRQFITQHARYATRSCLHTRCSDFTLIYGHDTISMLYSNTAYCVNLEIDTSFFRAFVSEGNRT